MGRDERTRAYAERRTAEGKSKRETMRCLKRYVARELFYGILLSTAVPNGRNPSTTILQSDARRASITRVVEAS